MPYDEGLATRVREALADLPDVVERKMFGGLAFMVGGHMCCGVTGEDLVIRVGADAHEDALTRPAVRPMDFTGRPLRGFVYVGAKGYTAASDLQRWIDTGLDFVRALPPKK